MIRRFSIMSVFGVAIGLAALLCTVGCEPASDGDGPAQPRQTKRAGPSHPPGAHAATVPGRVEAVRVKAGERVEAGTVLVVLRDPSFERALRDAQLTLKRRQVEYTNLQMRLGRGLLNQEAELARAKADHDEAQFVRAVRKEQFDDGLLPEIEYRRAALRDEQLAKRYAMEQQFTVKRRQSVTAQLKVSAQKVDAARQLLDLRKQQVASLEIKSAMAGVVQSVTVKAGDQVRAGTVVARVEPIE